MEKKFSKTKVGQYVNVLTKSEPIENDKITLAKSALNYWRSLHREPIDSFQKSLRENLTKHGIKNAIIANRLKRSVSIIEKLKRQPSMKLQTMQDIAGVRVILNDVQQVRFLEEILKGHSVKHKDYITNPANSGYRSIHLIFKHLDQRKPHINGLQVELQIRSKLQHIWATAVETMGTFLRFSLKSSKGPKEWLDYFSLASAGIAIIEGCQPHLKYQKSTRQEIFEKITITTKKLNIHEHLRAFKIAAEHITEEKKNYEYNLITLDLEEEFVNIAGYSKNEFDKANLDYTDIENEIDLGAPLQTVLVSTESIKLLQKAYPNFFLNSNEFLDILNSIEKDIRS